MKELQNLFLKTSSIVLRDAGFQIFSRLLT